MSSPRKRLSIAFLAGIVLIVGIVVWNKRVDNEEQTPETPAAVNWPKLSDLPQPETLVSRFLNTTAAAEYVGNNACTSCHPEQHDSYHLTDHSRALRKVDLTIEPPDTEYFHEPSNRWYKVYRDGDELRHRESIRDAEGRELVLHDKAVPWVIGSGHFSQSYLAEDGAFLIESPITWYTSRKAWEMSPGYDVEHHQGFERLADKGCIVCHAGQLTARDGNDFHPEILQMSIGCENCHGPGSLHVEKYNNPDLVASSKEDLTIVNPAHLSRELAESVCANCHLRGEATVYRRGREFNDFRPGMLLTDLRIDYGVRSVSGEMKVVGHVEQMRESVCYIESETLTCITCHDPHAQLAEAERVTFFRKSCLKCHTEESCGIERSVRIQSDPADNCVACHMPTTDTDIPHFAFTHHRIGIHKENRASQSAGTQGFVTLEPVIDPAEISTAESDRSMGLAYFEYAPKQPYDYSLYLEQARGYLMKGDRDREVAAALAGIEMELRLSDAPAWAALALEGEGDKITSRSKLNALIVRGLTQTDSGNMDSAIQDLRELVRLRRNADYWNLLAAAHLKANRSAEAISALEQAVEIAPHRVEFRQQLRELYGKHERLKDALKQQQAIEILTAPRAIPQTEQ